MRLVALLAGLGIAAGSAADTLHLPIGDPARKEREVRVVLDGISDARSGEVIAPDEMARRLATTRILFIGEEHTSADFHRVQLRTLQALVDAGREVMIGLEMFPYTQQAVLDRWSSGELSETQFMDPWYEYWSHHWGYYRDIFEYARARRLPLKGVNVPREAVRIARTQGFDALDEETRRHLPPTIDVADTEHRRLFDASFENDDPLHGNIPAAQREGLYRAQATWDAALGWNAMQALESSGRAGALMVVLLGSGHATYGLGAQRQIAGHFKGPVHSLVPVRVRRSDGANSVQASYADFLWGVPPEDGQEYPVLGVSLAGSLGSSPTKVIQVERGSSAEQAGVQVGDVLLSLDGRALTSSATLQRALANLAWGDACLLELRRATDTRRLTVPLRRTLSGG